MGRRLKSLRDGFGLQASGFRTKKVKTKSVIARAKPVAIYDFPLFLS